VLIKEEWNGKEKELKHRSCRKGGEYENVGIEKEEAEEEEEG
jgi:hypothetical protein